MRRNKGFSLIELLIVVAIILIIAAIAIPNLLSSRMAANESSAAGALQAIKTAEYAYFSAYPTIGYAASMSDLGGIGTPCAPSSAAACLLDTAVVAAVPGGRVRAVLYSTLPVSLQAGRYTAPSLRLGRRRS